jgi:hypothetical protein
MNDLKFQRFHVLFVPSLARQLEQHHFFPLSNPLRLFDLPTGCGGPISGSPASNVLPEITTFINQLGVSTTGKVL